MQRSTTMDELFESSTMDHIVTGSLKFTNKYCSQFQLFQAASSWTQEDEGVVFASVRTDGDDFIALDFRYDEKVKNAKHKSILYDFFKPMFEELLGGDYLQAWSISRGSVVVK